MSSRAAGGRGATIRLLVYGALLAFSSIFQMGYSNAYPNTAIEAFRVYLNESFHGTLDSQGFTWAWSAVLNIWFVGFAIGSWLAVPLADRIGRKSALLVGNAGNVISAFFSFLAIPLRLWWMFMGARLVFAAAAAVSMNSLILLLQESSPSSLRGTMSFYAEMAFVVTNAVGVICGMRIVLGDSLEWLTGLAIFPALLSFIIVMPFHESPKYLLLTKSNRLAASRSIQFYQSASVEEAESVLSAVEREGTAADESESSAGLMDLLRVPHLRKGLLLGVASMQLTTAVWPMIYLSTEFLVRANIDPSTAEAVSTAMMCLSTAATVIGMMIVEHMSRRGLLIGCAVVNVAALMLLVLSATLQTYVDVAKYGCILAVCLHGTSYSLALGPIAWFITAELLPQSHRATAQSIALSANTLIALVFCFVTLPAYDKLESFGYSGSLILLPLYVLPGIICILILFIYLPETRAVEIADVIKVLQGSSASPRLDKIEDMEMK